MVGGPSEVYASSRAAVFCAGWDRLAEELLMGTQGYKYYLLLRDRIAVIAADGATLLGLLLMGLQGQDGWRIAYFADNLQIFCFFLVASIKKHIFAADI